MHKHNNKISKSQRNTTISLLSKLSFITHKRSYFVSETPEPHKDQDIPVLLFHP